MASAAVARNGERAGVIALVAILLLGLGLRVGYAWDGRAPVFDAAAYARIAAHLDRGEGFTQGRTATQPASNYSPGLPLFVAALYRLTGGPHERLARLALAVIGSLSVLFTYLIGRRLSGPAAGLIGAAAVAVYPALLEYQGMLMGEPLAATLLSGATLSILWASDPRAATHLLPVAARVLSRGRGASGLTRPNPPSPVPPARRAAALRWLVPGLLLGALALVRPEYLAISLPIAIVVFARQGGDVWRNGLTQAAALLLGLVVVVAPWTVRNAVALDRFVPVSTGGGQVLFAGAYMPSDGNPERVGREVLERHPGLTRALALRHLPAGQRPKPRPAPPIDAVLANVRLEQILAAFATQRYPGMETDRALARMGRERLWRDIAEQPLSYTGFLATKLVRIWWHGPRDVMREPLWATMHWLLVALALVGLGLLVRHRPWQAALLATVLISTSAIGVLLVASPRRVLVAVPLVAALAGVAATACRDSLARWHR